MDKNSELSESARIDELLARVAMMEPGRTLPRLNSEQLLSLADSAKAWDGPGVDHEREPVNRATPRRRLRYVSIGALAGAGALATALLLSVSSVAPPSSATPPAGTKSALPSLVLRVDRKPLGSSTAETYNFQFTADPNLSTTSGTGTGYELTSPSDVEVVASEIESALGVSGPVIQVGSNDYYVGPSGGPDAMVSLENGVLHWEYPVWTDGASGESVPVDQGSPVPTDAQATASAQRQLESIGLSGAQLGTPLVSHSSTAVDVAIPMTVGGLSTDQYEEITYGAGGVVIYSSGIVATATPSAAYPTNSPAQAVTLLTGYSGVLTSGSGGASGSGDSNDVSVNIDEASAALSTYALTDGTTWLLPAWKLSGPASGSMLSRGTTFTGTALAVPAQYVQVGTTS